MPDSQEIRIQLRGWKAVAAVLVAVAVAGFTFLNSRSLDQKDMRPVIDVLEADYARLGLGQLRPAVEAGDEEAAAAAAAEMTARAGRVRLTSIRAKGSSTEPIVRVEIEVDGKAPPDNRPVRYFQMRYSTVTGWRMVRETTAFAYYTKLL